MKRALSFALVCSFWLPVGAFAQEEPATGEGTSSSFLDGLQWQVMASGSYLFNAHRVSGPYNDLGYPYTNYMGFGLNFAGGDVSYTGEKFALTIGLRFGTAAPQLSALAPLKQGFVSWIPHRKLTLDFGWFDTVFGAEVADEWQNRTFTRGALYFLQQPFNHMGVRIGATLTEKVTLRFLLVNNSVRVGELGGSASDTNDTPAIAAQLNLFPIDELTLQIGYMVGASGLRGNRAWGQFFDLILSAEIVRYMPVQYLIISLEPRFELSQQDLFFTRGSPIDPTTGNPSLHRSSESPRPSARRAPHLDTVHRQRGQPC
jgi:hypothetical protein